MKSLCYLWICTTAGLVIADTVSTFSERSKPAMTLQVRAMNNPLLSTQCSPAFQPCISLQPSPRQEQLFKRSSTTRPALRRRQPGPRSPNSSKSTASPLQWGSPQSSTAKRPRESTEMPPPPPKRPRPNDQGNKAPPSSPPRPQQASPSSPPRRGRASASSATTLMEAVFAANPTFDPNYPPSAAARLSSSGDLFAGSLKGPQVKTPIRSSKRIQIASAHQITPSAGAKPDVFTKEPLDGGPVVPKRYPGKAMAQGNNVIAMVRAPAGSNGFIRLTAPDRRPVQLTVKERTARSVEMSSGVPNGARAFAVVGGGGYVATAASWSSPQRAPGVENGDEMG